MKKILIVIGKSIGIIIAVPILLIVCLAYLLFVPFDIIRYHKMPYYKDLGIKYQFFITSRVIVKLYNRIARKELPIEYFNHNGFEYLVKDGEVLLCDWSFADFEQTEGEWYFVLDEENDTSTITMKEIIEEDLSHIKPEHRNLPTRLLLLYEDITDADRFEKAKECPYFYCVSLGDDI